MEKVEKILIEKLSGEEFNSLFNNYLTYINAPDEWRKNYEMLKEYIYHDYCNETGCSKRRCHKDRRKD